MRDLEVWGVPSYIVDIWEKSYSPYLLPVQEEAVRDYGVLDYEESKRDTSYDHQLKPAESRVLFSSLFRSAEKTLRNEGRAGFAPLRQLLSRYSGRGERT